MNWFFCMGTPDSLVKHVWSSHVHSGFFNLTISSLYVIKSLTNPNINKYTELMFIFCIAYFSSFLICSFIGKQLDPSERDQNILIFTR